jgi:polyhydroxyalkanoate synthesis repressor PhaR
MSETILLKKYANRRLYDTERSGYVTLEQVAEMIREGHAVKVEDAKTGEDVTAFILTQIVLENARKRNALLPASLLHLIIRYGDNVLSEFLETYLEQVMNNYVAYKSQADAQFRRWLQIGMNFSEAAQSSMKNFSPFGFPGTDEEGSKGGKKR